jgi:hypothetical protein
MDEEILPQYFLVRLEKEGEVHYSFCREAVSFNAAALAESDYSVGLKALEQVFASGREGRDGWSASVSIVVNPGGLESVWSVPLPPGQVGKTTIA